MKHIFLVSFLYFSSTELWADCRAEALNAKTRGHNHLVLTFEGLMGGVKGRAYQLAKTTNEQNSNSSVIQAYSHAGGASLAQSCIRAWKNVHGKNLRLTLVGHSFGGNAAMRLANILRSEGIEIEDLLLLDARDGSESFACRSLGKSFLKPQNVKNATAVYQNGCMAGRSLSGEENVSNLVEASGPLAHLNIPSSPSAVRAMASIFSKQNRPVVMEEEYIQEQTQAFSGNAESAEVESIPATPQAPRKFYKCELPNAPGIYVDCSKAQRDALDRRPSFDR